MMPVQGTTVTMGTPNSGSHCHDQCFIKIFRYIHLVVNIVCGLTAGIDYALYVQVKDVFWYQTLPDETTVRILFLIVIVPLVATSVVLVLSYRLVRPIYEIVYYCIASSALAITSLAFITFFGIIGLFFVNIFPMAIATVLSLINSALYSTSAFIMWKASKSSPGTVMSFHG